MLKIAVEEVEWGGLLMAWWSGEGAARVLEHQGDALLLKRADDDGKLVRMATSGCDDEASRIVCAIASIHAPKTRPLPELLPLTEWFRELEPAAATYGGVLVESAATARELLAEPQGSVTLHGDLHHGNLGFGPRSWLAIDPKRLLGERGFDTNIFCNPGAGNLGLEIARAPGQLARQSYIVAEAAGVERTRLLRWILAYAGLSAAWWLGDGIEPTPDFAVAQLAAAELGLEPFASRE